MSARKTQAAPLVDRDFCADNRAFVSRGRHGVSVKNPLVIDVDATHAR